MEQLTPAQLRNTKVQGEKSQAIVLAELLKLEVAVSLPFGDSQRYDLILDICGLLYRAQVKTAWTGPTPGTIMFNTSSTMRRNFHRPYTRGEVDLFVAYWPNGDRCFMMAIDEAVATSCTLRVDSTVPGGPLVNRLRSRNAEDYDLAVRVKRLAERAGFEPAAPLDATA